MGATEMADRACDECGEKVSASYWRVFSVNGVLHSCYACSASDGLHGPDQDESWI